MTTRLLPTPIRAARLGDPGFVSFVLRLHVEDVLDHNELIAWLHLHGAVMRATLPPLDTGEGIPEDALRTLQEEIAR
jgi:hypothetical protein